MILDKDIHYLKTNFLRGRTRPLNRNGYEQNLSSIQLYLDAFNIQIDYTNIHIDYIFKNSR